MNIDIKTLQEDPTLFTKLDKAFAATIMIVGFLYWNLIPLASLGAGVSIFALILCTVAFYYLKRSGLHQTKESILWLGIIAISAANFAIFDNNITKSFNFIFLSCSFVYWVCLTARSRLDVKLSIYIIGDMVNQLLIIPFYNFSSCFSALKHGVSKNKHGKSFLNALIGILVIFPIIALVISLLIAADAAFESFAAQIHFSLSSDMVEYLIQLILGIPVALYIYGLVYGNRYARHTKHMTLKSVEKNAFALKFAPKITVYSALTALNAIYLVFFFAQASYLFSALAQNIPVSMTYAEYARRGFFELCTISGINLVIIAVAYLIINRKSGNDDNYRNDGKAPKMLRYETVSLCLFTLMLIITAVSKMAMYINYYGLTQLRLYTTWFMIIMLIIFIIITVRQFNNFNASKLIIISFIIGFMLLSYGNIDGMIAKYNIDRFTAGTLKAVDVQALDELSDAAVPYIYKLYQETDDAILKNQLKSAITGVYEWGVSTLPYEPTFRDFNLQKFKADQIRANI